MTAYLPAPELPDPMAANEVRFACPRCGATMKPQGANLAVCPACDTTVRQPH